MQAYIPAAIGGVKPELAASDGNTAHATSGLIPEAINTVTAVAPITEIIAVPDKTVPKKQKNKTKRTFTVRFYFYVNKDYDGDRNVATFSNTSHGWSITWLADGRMRWSTYWSGSGYHSYSSNYIGAYNWCYIQVWSDSTGTGAGNMSFNGTWASANRSGRHQWGGQTLTLGTWGMMYRGDMHSYGIDGGGSYCDYWSNVNNYTVGWADVTENNVYRNGNTRVTQDTWVTWD